MDDLNGVADPMVQTPDSGAQDDLYGSLFNDGLPAQEDPNLIVGYDAKPAFMPTSQPPVPAVAPAANPSVEEKRYQYWQSEATKRDRQLKEIAPLVNLIEQDPQIMALVEKKLNSQNQQPQPNTQSIVVPQAPVKPAGYNPFDADPASESYKYRMALEDFRDKKIEYLEEMSQKQQEAFQMREQQEQRNNEAQQRMYSLQNELITKHGYTQEEVPGFIQRMSSPESLTIENLAKFDRFLASQNGVQPQQRTAGQALAQRQQRSIIPAPIVAGASNQPPGTDNDGFNDSLRSWVRKPVPMGQQ